MPLCREGELAELWKPGGLVEVAGRPLDITMRFGSFSDYWEPFLAGQGPAGAWVRRMDAGRRDDLRSEVKRLSGLQSENVAFSLAARAWAVRGVVPGKAGARG